MNGNLRAASRFFNLPLREKAVVGEATLILALVASGLRVAPGSWIGRALRQASKSEGKPLIGSAVPIAQAVQRVARYVPNASCLAQALTAWVMLRRRRLPARVAIGVRSRDATITAHAWLESGGHIVLGAEEAQEHKRFPSSE